MNNPNQCLQSNSFSFNSTSTVGTQSYTFSPSLGAPPNGNTPNYGPVSFTSPGTYTVTYSNSNAGCTSSTYSVINIYPTPTLNIVNNTPICAGNSASITLNTPVISYTWSGPGSFSSNAQNPTINSTTTSNTGVYQVNIKDVNGCVNSGTTNVIINPNPQITIPTPTACSGGSFTLTTSGGTTYQWTGPGGFTSNLQNPTFTNSNSTLNGVYSVLVTDANGCTGSNSVTVNVNPSFTISVTNNSPICEKSILQINSPAGYIYNWTGPNGFTSTSQSPQIINTSLSSSGQYSLTAFDLNGCQGNAVTNVVINPLPTASIISSKDKICTPACIDFTLSSSNLNNIDWVFAGGVPETNTVSTQCYTQGGIYSSTATITDNNGCKNIITHSVEVYNTPTADFIFNPLRPIEKDEVHLTNSSYGSNSLNYEWYINSILTYTVPNPTTIFSTPGTYPITLVIKTDKGCSDTISKIINVGEDYFIYVPNVFTPNQDGLNDTFQPKGQGIVKYQLMIFDRWGEMIYETKEFNQGWDGKHHRGIDYGTYCKDDIYTWLIKVVDTFGKSHELKGHVTLIK